MGSKTFNRGDSKMSKELKQKASKLIKSAYEYWEEYQRQISPHDAVVWLEATCGHFVLFTRGEYKKKIMAVVDGINETDEPLKEPFIFDKNDTHTLQAELALRKQSDELFATKIVPKLKAELAEANEANETLGDRCAELEAALNMEEEHSQFHPKIPYKWKYEQQYERGKRQGVFIKKLKAQLHAHRWIPVSEGLPKIGDLVLVVWNSEMDQEECPSNIEYVRWDNEWPNVDSISHWKPIDLPEKEIVK